MKDIKFLEKNIIDNVLVIVKTSFVTQEKYIDLNRMFNNNVVFIFKNMITMSSEVDITNKMYKQVDFESIYQCINEAITRNSKDCKYVLVIEDCVNIDDIVPFIHSFNDNNDDDVFAACPIVCNNINDNYIESAGFGFSNARPKHLFKGVKYDTIKNYKKDIKIISVSDIIAIYNIEKLENLNLFPELYKYKYSEIHLCIEAFERGYKTILLKNKVKLVRQNPIKAYVEEYLKDVQKLYNIFEINEINKLNNTDRLFGYKQQPFFSTLPHTGSYSGKLLIVTSGDHDITYYRIANKIPDLRKHGWHITITNLPETRLFKQADVVLVQYDPTITDNLIFSLIDQCKEKLIVDVNDIFFESNNSIKFSRVNGMISHLEQNNIQIISNSTLRYNGPNLIVDEPTIATKDFKVYRSMNRDSDKLNIGVYGEDASHYKNLKKELRTDKEIVTNLIGIPNDFCDYDKYIGYNYSSDFPHRDRLRALARNKIDFMFVKLDRSISKNIYKLLEPMYLSIPVFISGDINSYTNCRLLDYTVPYNIEMNNTNETTSIELDDDNIKHLNDIGLDGRIYILNNLSNSHNIHKYHNLFASKTNILQEV